MSVTVHWGMSKMYGGNQLCLNLLLVNKTPAFAVYLRFIQLNESFINLATSASLTKLVVVCNKGGSNLNYGQEVDVVYM